jgi:hypothetical protein
MSKFVKNTRVAAVVAALIVPFSLSAQDRIITESTSNSTVNSSNISETTVKSPPPSAISPGITIINNDLCTVGVAGAVQTQILGVSGGTTVRDLNCERLKLAKNLYDMGMKVAAVATLCQDERVFAAMQNAGTPCPVDGKIGAEAKAVWDANPTRQPDNTKERASESIWEKIAPAISIGLLLLFLL